MLAFLEWTAAMFIHQVSSSSGTNILPPPHAKHMVLLGAPLCRPSPSALELSWTNPNLSQRSFKLALWKETWSHSAAELVNVRCESWWPPYFRPYGWSPHEKRSHRNRDKGTRETPGEIWVPGRNSPSPSCTPALPSLGCCLDFCLCPQLALAGFRALVTSRILTSALHIHATLEPGVKREAL